MSLGKEIVGYEDDLWDLRSKWRRQPYKNQEKYTPFQVNNEGKDSEFAMDRE